jgi:hypothetical protein
MILPRRGASGGAGISLLQQAALGTLGTVQSTSRSPSSAIAVVPFTPAVQRNPHETPVREQAGGGRPDYLSLK